MNEHFCGGLSFFSLPPLGTGIVAFAGVKGIFF